MRYVPSLPVKLCCGQKFKMRNVISLQFEKLYIRVLSDQLHHLPIKLWYWILVIIYLALKIRNQP